jgi:hypothetical protein
MLAVERERGKRRKSEGGEVGGKGGGNVSTSLDTGKARDKAAEKVNADVSGRTLEKADCGGAGRSAPVLKNVFAGGCE